MGFGAQGSGVTHSCELPGIGARNQTQVLSLEWALVFLNSKPQHPSPTSSSLVAHTAAKGSNRRKLGRSAVSFISCSYVKEDIVGLQRWLRG
ncbi:hypothetical protein I79_021499 [Cricetulus griseus]|uniref:Uncharacterized protein n=1 Tax=Cricetulus griseus TaxID=10029 RepID=G3ICU6_CRIGR|nr:hypothetical protein I79_021499 [Cricetulus griseus]